MKRVHAAWVVTAVFGCSGAQRTSGRDPTAPTPVLQICLAGEAASRSNEYSGLAWHGDTLYLLPQWSAAGLARARSRPGFRGPWLYRIPGAQLRDWVDGRDRRPITPERVPFDILDLANDPDWQGFEAIAFDGDEAALLVELGSRDRMAGLFATAAVDVRGGLAVHHDALRLEVPHRSNNHAYEALTRVGGSWLALFELNGMDPSCASEALRVGVPGSAPGAVAVEAIPYRVTDATTADAEGRFWVTQYSYRDPQHNAECETSIQAVGCFHEPVDCDTRGGATRSVERLLELRDDGIAIRTTGRMVQLQREERPRNWEGLARFEGRGFLVVTDEWPGSILGFVPSADRPLPTPAPPCPTE